MGIFDATPCHLGEGALWHPNLKRLFWFDINGKRLYSRSLNENKAQHWQFTEHVSAAAVINDKQLLVASESALFSFNIDSELSCYLVDLERDNPLTRSNDARADPFGGFWVSTMAKNAQRKAGAIYRLYRGELRKLYSGLTIPNAICFTPCGKTAYFADTPTAKIMKVSLNGSGWPIGKPEKFIDMQAEKLAPDGAVVDSHGCLWNAQWGLGRVARYDAKGNFMHAVATQALHTTCPAFGGDDLNILFVTSANEEAGNMTQNGKTSSNDGNVFFELTNFTGQAEHMVDISDL